MSTRRLEADGLGVMGDDRLVEVDGMVSLLAGSDLIPIFFGEVCMCQYIDLG
jgi:hypothetical protein